MDQSDESSDQDDADENKSEVIISEEKNEDKVDGSLAIDDFMSSKNDIPSNENVKV